MRRRQAVRLADMLDPCRRTGAEADTAAAVVAVVAEAVFASATTDSALEDWIIGYWWGC